jgi:hypothetical protein
VALEALGGDGVEVPAALVAATAKFPKKMQSRRAFDARAKNRDTKFVKSSLALEGFSILKVAVLHAVDVMIEALKFLKGELAESKDQPEQGYSRGGRGNASGSGEQGALQQPGLSELIAKSARPATDPRGSAGVVHKMPWPFLLESAHTSQINRSRMAPSISSSVFALPDPPLRSTRSKKQGKCITA